MEIDGLFWWNWDIILFVCLSNFWLGWEVCVSVIKSILIISFCVVCVRMDDNWVEVFFVIEYNLMLVGLEIGVLLYLVIDIILVWLFLVCCIMLMILWVEFDLEMVIIILVLLNVVVIVNWIWLLVFVIVIIFSFCNLNEKFLFIRVDFLIL